MRERVSSPAATVSTCTITVSAGGPGAILYNLLIEPGSRLLSNIVGVLSLVISSEELSPRSDAGMRSGSDVVGSSVSILMVRVSLIRDTLPAESIAPTLTPKISTELKLC